MSPNYYPHNNILINRCQDDIKNNPDFYAELQRLHKKNKKQLYKLALSKDEIEKAERIIHCSDYLTYQLINQQYIRLSRINLCRERLCLNCQLAKSRETVKSLFWSIPRLELKADEKLYHIVLTTPNCSASNLRATIQKLTERQKAMFRHFNITDYFRSIEITKNESSDTWHPHLHIIAILSQNCKLPHSGTLESVNGLRSIWHKWLNSESEYNFTLATCHELKDTSGIFEVCKYIAKVEEMQDINNLRTLDNQIHGLRLKTPCGQFKSLIREYKKECNALKLEELAALEEAEIYLIDMIYQNNRYNIKRIYQKINYSEVQKT